MKTYELLYFLPLKMPPLKSPYVFHIKCVKYKQGEH
jgi:hypothetical protein